MSKSVVWMVVGIAAIYYLLKKAGSVVTEAYNSPAVQTRLAQQQVSSIAGSTSQAVSDVANSINAIISSVKDIDWGIDVSTSSSPATDISELIALGEWH